MQDLLLFCESQLEWAVDTTVALVEAESPSTDKAALDRCGSLVAERLAAIGGRVRRLSQDRTGDPVRAEYFSGDHQVLLLGHFDTVWPSGQLARMPVCREGDRLFGPGVFDMKGGIAIGMLAVRALEQSGGVPIRVVMLWTADEEVGSAASREAIEAEALRSDAVLVLEPALPGGALKTSRKGVGQFELTVRGVAAHAGVDPDKGASAIHELARQIVRIEQLQDLSRGVSVNVGVISGGSRPNVIADEARAIVDVRAPRAEDAMAIETALRALRPEHPAASLHLEGGFERPPLERTAGVARLFGLAREVASHLGRQLEEGGTGGGSDGNFTGALGVSTLDGLGAVGDGAHAAHEHIVLTEVPWRAALVAGLIRAVATQAHRTQ